MTYLTNSLFDYRSPENNGIRAEFILDAAGHKVLIFSFLKLMAIECLYLLVSSVAVLSHDPCHTVSFIVL